MKYLRKANQEFVSTHGNHKWIFALVGTAGIALLASFEPLFLKYIIDVLSTDTSDLFEHLKSVVLLWVVYALILISMRYAIGVWVRKRTLEVYNGLLKKNMSMLHRIGYHDYLSEPRGRLSKVVTEGIESVFKLLYDFFLNYVQLFVFVIMSIAIMFWTNWRMSIITLIVLPALLYVVFVFFIKCSKTQADLESVRDEAFDVMGDSLLNMGVLKTFTIEQNRMNLINDAINRATGPQNKLMYSWTTIKNAGQVIMMIARILVIVGGVYLYGRGLTTIGEVVMFLTYVELVYGPINAFMSQLESVNKAEVWYEKMEVLFNKFAQGFEDLEVGKKVKTYGDLLFEKLSFDYSPSKALFRDLSFTLPQGSSLALVGETGTGKSTIAHLLLRFREPTQGGITRGGQPISDVSLKSLRSHIGVVQQDTTLFNTTIYNNLLWISGQDDSPELREKIIEALHNAQASFVFDLPDGLETVIGERGLKLSGGEKQRIALARVLLTKPKLLILDEATSALDTNTEQVVKQVIQEQFANTTKLIIAHRLSTIQHVDQIIVLGKNDDGTTSIKEQGTYDELIQQQGILWKLANPAEVEVRF